MREARVVQLATPGCNPIRGRPPERAVATSSYPRDLDVEWGGIQIERIADFKDLGNDGLMQRFIPIATVRW